MSMILDALRKSEAERRRAQAPDLFAQPALTQPTTASAYPRRVWWMLAAVAVIAVTVWLARSLTTAPVRAPASTAPMPATAADAATTALPSRTLPRIETAPPPVATTAPVIASTPAAPPTVTPATVAAPATATAPPPQPGPASDPAAPAPATSARPPQREPVVIESAPAATSTGSPTSTAGGTLRIADLSVEERQQLPPLKMSMHLWNPAEAQRFVILDGTRAGQGDSVGDVVVEQITADGVVLSWRGRRLKLPIR